MQDRTGDEGNEEITEREKIIKGVLNENPSTSKYSANMIILKFE